jgi:hypothetical protein
MDGGLLNRVHVPRSALGQTTLSVAAAKSEAKTSTCSGSLEFACPVSLTTRCIPTGAPTVLHKFVAKAACGYREAEQFEPRGLQPACQRGYGVFPPMLAETAEWSDRTPTAASGLPGEPPSYRRGAGGFPSKSAPLPVPRAARAFHERGSPRLCLPTNSATTVSHGGPVWEPRSVGQR